MTATQAKAARTAANNAETAKAAVASAVLPADATAAADDAEYEANAAISAAREAEGAADEAEAASSTAGAAKATAEGAAAEAKATFETENMPAGKAWALGFVALLQAVFSALCFAAADRAQSVIGSSWSKLVDSQLVAADKDQQSLTSLMQDHQVLIGGACLATSLLSAAPLFFAARLRKAIRLDTRVPTVVSMRMRASWSFACHGACLSGASSSASRVSSTSPAACQTNRYGLMVVPNTATNVIA